MPKELETRLRREAKRKGLKGDRQKAYVYGTMNRITGDAYSDKKKR